MFSATKHGAIDVVQGEGPLTHENCEELSQITEACLRDGMPMAVIDLWKVDLIDSAGLEGLLDAQDQFQMRGGSLKIAALNPLCSEILAITGVADRFEIYPDVKGAVRSFL